jgi:hypothetical protein
LEGITGGEEALGRVVRFRRRGEKSSGIGGTEWIIWLRGWRLLVYREAPLSEALRGGRGRRGRGGRGASGDGGTVRGGGGGRKRYRWENRRWRGRGELWMGWRRGRGGGGRSSGWTESGLRAIAKDAA